MPGPSASIPQFLVHRAGDHVAVAVADLQPGPAHGVSLDTDTDLDASVTQAVPFGHKFALTSRQAGEEVIEYGQRIGLAASVIRQGDHVHVHNLRSARWPQSTNS